MEYTERLVLLVSDINDALTATRKDRDKWKTMAEVAEQRMNTLSQEKTNLTRSHELLRDMLDKAERNAAKEAVFARERIDSMMATIDDQHARIASLRAANEINEDTIIRLITTVTELTNRLTAELSGRT